MPMCAHGRSLAVSRAGRARIWNWRRKPTSSFWRRRCARSSPNFPRLVDRCVPARWCLTWDRPNDRSRTQWKYSLHPLSPSAGIRCAAKNWRGLTRRTAQLFRGAAFVLTPLARTAPSTLNCAKDIVQAIGARPLILDPARHDQIVATTSHLPFAIAALLMTTANDLALHDELVFALAASGFRDTSRLAASDTQMMSDVLLTNSQNVGSVLRDYGRHLNTLADVVEQKDETTLNAILLKAAAKRRELFHS